MVNLTGLMVTPTIQSIDPTNMTISHTDGDFTVGPVTGSGTTYSKGMMFKSLNTSHAGVYTCSASYDVVSNTATTSITVKSMHICVSNVPSRDDYALNSNHYYLYTMLFPLLVPSPTVAVNANPSRTLYTGESVVLTCTITLDSAVDSSVTVTASWSKPGGAITTGVANMTDTAPYQSTLTFSSLVTSDFGMYTCTASVNPVDPMYITGSENGSDTHTIAVGRCTIINVTNIVDYTVVSRLLEGCPKHNLEHICRWVSA